MIAGASSSIAFPDASEWKEALFDNGRAKLNGHRYKTQWTHAPGNTVVLSASEYTTAMSATASSGTPFRVCVDAVLSIEEPSPFQTPTTPSFAAPPRKIAPLCRLDGVLSLMHDDKEERRWLKRLKSVEHEKEVSVDMIDNRQPLPDSGGFLFAGHARIDERDLTFSKRQSGPVPTLQTVRPPPTATAREEEEEKEA